jgi:hypothetical protein
VRRKMTVTERLLTRELFEKFAGFASAARSSVLVIAPFITRRALDSVIGRLGDITVSVITTWTLRDALRGASDPCIYPYLRERGWELRLHPHLHAKLIVTDWERLIVSTANITQAGLGLIQPNNVECALGTTSLLPDDQCWIFGLLCHAQLVDDEVFSDFMAQLAGVTPRWANTFSEFDPSLRDDRFDSSLLAFPASDSPRRLLTAIDAIRAGAISSFDRTTIDATIHDLHLLPLDVFAPQHENALLVAERFFALPGVAKLTRFLNETRYFGEVKNWLRRFCRVYPVPSVGQLTRGTQTLFKWIGELGAAQYVVTQPHYSQSIVHLTPNTGNVRAERDHHRAKLLRTERRS